MDDQPKDGNTLQTVSTRLFADDVTALKRIAQQRGIKWQIELRLLVRKALRGIKQDIVIIKERT